MRASAFVLLAAAGTCSCAQLASADDWPGPGAAGAGPASSGTGASAGGMGGGNSGGDGGGAASTCPTCAAPCALRFGENFKDERNGVTADVGIQANFPNDHNGGALFWRVDGDPEMSVGLLRFDVSVLAGKTICEADLRLIVGEDSSSDDFYVTEVGEEWVEAEATWFQRTGSEEWDEAGCLGEPSCNTAHQADIPGPFEPEDEVHVPLSNALVQKWLNAENFGMAFRGNATNSVEFRSREARDGQRPSLLLTYTD